MSAARLEGRTLFVTGTDTGCGKTVASCALARSLAASGYRVACFKPVASGCEATPHGLRNDDALALQAAASVELAYDQVNPYPLRPPIAPHIAAEQASIVFDIELICREILSTDADFRIVEGVGGWLVPLDQGRRMPDLARCLEAEVVLVVGLRLGCLNHALLTARTIAADGFELAGWVASPVDPEMAEVDAVLDYLAEHLDGPLLGRLDHVPDAERRARFLNPERLLAL